MTDLERAIRTAGVLSAIAYTGLLLVLPRRVRAHLFDRADHVTHVTHVIVTAALTAWDIPTIEEQHA